MNGEEGSFMMSHFGTTFHDFAGSTVVHSVGGWIALVGAAILGPRIGKYGKDGKSKAIPGHSLTIAALGVFILWFGWFGFNPGSQLAAATEADVIAISDNEPGCLCRWFLCSVGELDEIWKTIPVIDTEWYLGRAGRHHSRM